MCSLREAVKINFNCLEDMSTKNRLFIPLGTKGDGAVVGLKEKQIMFPTVQIYFLQKIPCEINKNPR